MATNLDILVNYVDATVDKATDDSKYILLDTDNDYLIWTEGSAVVQDLMTHEPTQDELNAAATLISETLAVTVSKCFLMDYSHNVGGSYYTHKVMGMGENKRFVFCFSFDGATATEPQLEAWDDIYHTSAVKNILGAGTPNSSMVKAICTTLALPGEGWVGSPLAGANVVLLNNGNGALSTPPTGETNDLYSNLKIVIPAAFAVPSAENFVFTVRYSWSS
jgi:hypothetical protein